MLLPLRFRGVAMATLVPTEGNCNTVGSGFPTEGRESTVKTEESGFAFVLTVVDAATVRMPPRTTEIRAEMG